MGLRKRTLASQQRLFGRGQQRVRLARSQHWVVSLNWSYHSNTQEARQLKAWRDSLKARGGQFQCWHLARPQPVGLITGTPTLSVSASQDDRELSLMGLTPGARVLEVGDMIGVFGELHQITEPVTASSFGLATAQIAPARRHTAVAQSPVLFDRPAITFAIQSDPEYSDDGKMVSCQLIGVEQ